MAANCKHAVNLRQLSDCTEWSEQRGIEQRRLLNCVACNKPILLTLRMEPAEHRMPAAQAERREGQG